MVKIFYTDNDIVGAILCDCPLLL